MRIRVHANSYVVDGQTEQSEKSYQTIGWDEVELKGKIAIDKAIADGKELKDIMVLDIDPEGITSGVAYIEDGDEIFTESIVRFEGDTPMPSRYKYGVKSPAVACALVMYSSILLSKEQPKAMNEMPASEGNYEIISMNGRITIEEEPINPSALERNFKGLPGGTKDPKMTEEIYIADKKVSDDYWIDKVMVKPYTPEMLEAGKPDPSSVEFIETCASESLDNDPYCSEE